jgi:TRAP-type C4-dicarboxylate transport system substrate-binding protein
MKKRGLLRSAGVLMVIGLLLLSFHGTAQAKKYRLTIGTGHPLAAVWVERVQNFFCVETSKRVAEKTKHTLEWNYAWGGSVAKLGEALEAVQDGLLDASLVGFPFEPTKLALHNFCYFTPFASPDIHVVSKVATGVFNEVPYLAKVFEKKYNQKYLGGGACMDSYHLITNFQWKTVDDLKGRKIAAAGPNLTYVKAVGAVPVQSNLNEAYTSLQTGVYDGWVIFRDAAAGFKLYEVAPYYTFCDMGAIFVAGLTMNLDRWNGLPGEVQAILKEVAAEYTANESKTGLAKAEAGEQVMRKAGVKFSRLSWEEKVRWAGMMPNVPREKAKAFEKQGLPGTKVFKAYIQGSEKAGFKFPRKWNLD